MAATKQDKSCVMHVVVETGKTASGGAAYSTRSFANINPALVDDDFLSIGNALAGLQMYPLGSIQRVDMAKVVEA